MSGKLTTHVLNTATGKPAAGMRIELHRLVDRKKVPLADRVTNRDGRTDVPMLAGDEMIVGTYRLLFYVADYFTSVGSPDAGKFLDVVPILFRVDDAAAGYHVPLLVSPWAYSTYRGS
jgi:5-hydroxyisourate hydrolase